MGIILHADYYPDDPIGQAAYNAGRQAAVDNGWAKPDPVPQYKAQRTTIQTSIDNIEADQRRLEALMAQAEQKQRQAEIAEANKRNLEKMLRDRAPFDANNMCNSGNMNMCYNAGYSYEGHNVIVNGVQVFLGVDYFKAAEFYSKACKGGMMKGCTALGILYKNGKGVTQSDDKAAELYSKACNANEPTGCNNLGTLYQNGYGYFWDKWKAKDLYHKACQMRFQQGCENYAKVNK